MKFLSPILGVIAVFTVATSGASAQALDAASGRQAVLDLTSEVRRSSAMYLVSRHEPQNRDACEPIDPTELAQAQADLNAYDQRAVAVANATSGGVHVQAMNLVRIIENGYILLSYPIIPERCYVAPGSSSVVVDQHHGVIRAESHPCLGNLALDGEHAQNSLATISVNIVPVEWAGPFESVSQEDRHILDWGSYTCPLVGPAPLVREIVAELATRAFGTAAESAIAST